MDSDVVGRVFGALAVLAPTRAGRSEYQLMAGGYGSAVEGNPDQAVEQKLVSSSQMLEVQITTGDAETVEMCLAAVLQDTRAFGHATSSFVSRLVDRRTEAAIAHRILKGIFEGGMVIDEASLIRLLVEYVDGRVGGTNADNLRQLLATRLLATRLLAEESFARLVLAAMRTIARHPQGVDLVERVFPLLRSCCVERPDLCRDLLFDVPWNPAQRFVVLLEARVAIEAEGRRFSERFATIPDAFSSTTPILYRAATEALQGLVRSGPYGNERVHWSLRVLAQGEPTLVERVLVAAHALLPHGDALELRPAGETSQYVFGGSP